LNLWRRIPAFVWGDVAGALIAGLVAGAFFDATAMMIFPAVMVGNALTGLLVCWWALGFTASGWKLWLVATIANPMLIGGIVWAAMDYDCLFAGKSGWSCLLSDVGPFIAGMSLIPPLVGLIVRGLAQLAETAASSPNRP